MHRLGALLYVLWGALHLLAAVEGFRLATTVDAGLIQGRLFQNSAYLVFFSLVAIGVAVTMNWRNYRTGYWINLIAISSADIPFILFVLLPGHVPWWPGVAGPTLWLLAVVFSTLGLQSSREVSPT